MAQFQKCPHCHGFGYIRSVDSAAIMALRSLEEEGVRARTTRVALHIPNAIALYILNSKRDMLATIEQRYAFKVMINVDESLAPSDFRVEVLRDDHVSRDEDDVDSVDDVVMDEPGPGTQRRVTRNKKPVLMEQALEHVSDRDAAVDTSPENGLMDDDIDRGDENFNRPDIEPDSELNKIPGVPRGPRRNNGRGGGRDRNRHRERTPRMDQDQQPIDNVNKSQGNDSGSTGRDDRPARQGQNRGPRRNNMRNRGENRSGGDHKRSPRGSQDESGHVQSDHVPMNPRSFDHAGDVPMSATSAADSSSVSTNAKSGATYFVAKRRLANTHNDGGDQSPAPVIAPVVSALSTDVQSQNTSDGPKKKGWWSKFS